MKKQAQRTEPAPTEKDRCWVRIQTECKCLLQLFDGNYVNICLDVNLSESGGEYRRFRKVIENL